MSYLNVKVLKYMLSCRIEQMAEKEFKIDRIIKRKVRKTII